MRGIGVGRVTVKLQALMCEGRNNPRCKEAKSGERNEKINIKGCFSVFSSCPVPVMVWGFWARGTFPDGQVSISLCEWHFQQQPAVLLDCLNRIRAQALWFSESCSCLAGHPKIKSVIWPRGSKFSWKEYDYQVSREERMGSSPSLFSVTDALDCSRTMHMDTVSNLWLSEVYLNIITNFAGLHIS